MARHGGGDRVSGAAFATRSPVLGVNGMAATSHPLASEIAVDILKAGGSAADAAIAANAALGLMEPTGCGVGGDIFVIVWDPETQRLHGLNGSGRAPLGQSLADLRARLGDAATQLPDYGALSVSVPGTVDGWFAIHDRFGKLPMAEILAPTVAYARQGFPVSQVIALYMADFQEIYEERHAAGEIEEIDNYRATYLIDGNSPAEGEIFRNSDLADTLEAIGRDGRVSFYKGALARVMADYMARIDGPLTYDDFAAHRSEWVDPLSVDYKGYKIWELPPAGQGIAVLQMLNILEGIDLKAMGHNSAAYLHHLIEAKKIVFEDRARFYADMAFAEVPLERLLSKEYGAERRGLIAPDRVLQNVEPGDMRLAGGDTVYLTVADGDGMMVSMIQSNYRGMGSGLVPDGLGFTLQNRGALFYPGDGHANSYAPGKRPFHTIIPAFVTQAGAPLISFGVMGADMQPQGHVQVLLNMIEFGMNVQEAGDAARFRHGGSSEPFIADGRMADGGYVQLESGIGEEAAAALEALGHHIEPGDGRFGGYQAILRDPDSGVYWGASEMRKDGMAIGY